MIAVDLAKDSLDINSTSMIRKNKNGSIEVLSNRISCNEQEFSNQVTKMVEDFYQKPSIPYTLRPIDERLYDMPFIEEVIPNWKKKYKQPFIPNTDYAPFKRSKSVMARKAKRNKKKKSK